MAIFFSSDQHYWHNNVIRYCNRPFSTVEEMNQVMIDNWNNIVKPEDTVFCIGDFSLAARPVETITPQLVGKKYLIPGNHDFVHSYNKKARNPGNRQKWVVLYTQSGWEVLSEQYTLEVPGISKLKLCHFPYVENLDYPDKFAKWRPADDGTILLHGHIHEKAKVQMTSNGTLMINVGVDVWDYKPVSLDQIIEIIEQEGILCHT